MTYYSSSIELPIYEDCTFSSKIIGNIKEQQRFTIQDNVGVWYRIDAIDKSGWIYGYYQNKNIIHEDYTADTHGIRIGNLIVLNTNKNAIKDYYGKTVTARKNGEPVLYKVTQIVQNPLRIEFSSNTEWYSMEVDKVSKFSNNSNKRTMISSMAARDGKPDDDKTEQEEAEKKKKEKEEKARTLEPIIAGINDFFKTRDAEVSETLDKYMDINGIRNIFGMPYQFMPIADMRIDNGNSYTSIGRKYGEKIVSRMPLLIMVPGTSEFMRKYDEDERSDIMKAIAFGDSASQSLKDKLGKTANKAGDYYSFYADWNKYYKFVNPLCRIAATLLKINDVQIPTNDGDVEVLGKYRWQDAGSQNISSAMCYKGGCAWYLNTDSQVSESWSNETAKPSIADKINGISDKVRELQFLVGGAFGTSVFGNNVGEKKKEDKEKDKEAAKEANKASGFLDGVIGTSPSVIGSICNAMGDVVAGAKMVFPELWSDSSFSKDYSISIKLISPDADNLSVYLTIIVPLIHLLGLVAPHSLSSASTYSSPFLIRAFYRGFFNINMGIITNMSVSKGGEGKWAYSGMPVEVDVNITIKDLYDQMSMMINESGGFDTDFTVLSNTNMMDYLSNMCGININEPDLARTLILYKIMLENKASDLFPNLGERLNQWIMNKYMNLFEINR